MAVGKSSILLHIDPPEINDREGFIFISYKNDEAAAAELIREFLKKAGFPVWWDKRIHAAKFGTRYLMKQLNKPLVWSCFGHRSPLNQNGCFTKHLLQFD